MIIPIGTKSTLALKPKVTISLIAACTLIYIFSFLQGGQTGEELFKLHRKLYASQVRLYLYDRSADSGKGPYLDPQGEAGIEMIERADDYSDMQIGIMEAMNMSCTAIETIQEYEKVLVERNEDYYPDGIARDELNEWNRLKNREDDILNSHVTYALGLVPSKMSRFYTFITHIFLHGDIWHLLGNMLFLWVVGCLLEDSWGRMPFLGFFILGGVFAGLAHCLQDTGSNVPLIGASGAIAAAMGAFTIRHFMTKIKFFYFFLFLFRPVWGTFHLPAFVFLPFWFFQQIAMKSFADMAGAAGGGVAYMAHIAGYLAGIVAALSVKATGLEKKWINPMVQKKQISEGVLKDPRFNEACRQLNEGGVERARILFDRLIKENPEDISTMQDIAVLYREHGLPEESGGLYDTALKTLFLRSKNEEAVHLVLGLIAARGNPVPVNPHFIMNAGKYLAGRGNFGEAIDAYRYIIKENLNPQVTVKASIALARLLGEKMDNRRDAIAVLEEAKDLAVGSAWLERIIETEAILTTEKHWPLPV